jgi:hypothetical protein
MAIMKKTREDHYEFGSMSTDWKKKIEKKKEKEREKSLLINRTSTTNKEIDKEKEVMLLQKEEMEEASW